MGNPVIQLALEALRAEGFAAGAASYVTKAPVLLGTVAAVGIHGADWKKQTVTLSIEILCPEAMGAVCCQSEALRAGEILTRAGARCSQGSCGYDGLYKTFSVEVLAEFTGSIREKEFVPEDPAEQSRETMTFKSFVWPENPEDYREELVREPMHIKNGDRWIFQGMGEAKRVITGSGAFSGPEAFERFKALASLFSDTQTGTLTHPVWGSRTVYFTGLELTQSVKPEYVAYSFEFRETDSNGNLPH